MWWFLFCLSIFERLGGFSCCKITFFCFYFCFNTKSIFPSTDNPIFTPSNSLNGIKKAFLFCLLNGNFLDAAIAIYYDIHALGRRGYSLTIERIAGDFLHIAAICHLVNTCRVILYDVSKVFPDVSICISLFGSLRDIQSTIADHNIVEKGAGFNWILPSDIDRF